MKKMFTKNVVFLLNITGWFLVFYFSMSEDKLAASLSYISTALTVLTMNYISREVSEVDDFLVHVIDTASQTLIVRGFSLVAFSQFWNTAFYAVCLGILIQNMKHVMLSRVCPSLYMKVSLEDTNMDSLQEFKSCILSQDSTEVNGNKTEILNKTEHCNAFANTDEKNNFPVQRPLEINDTEIKHLKEFIKEMATSSDKALNRAENFNFLVEIDENNEIPVQNSLQIDDIKSKQLKEFIKEKVQNSDRLNTFELDFSETAYGHQEKIKTSDRKTMLHGENLQRQKESPIESDESAVKCKENLNRPNFELNAEDKIPEILNLYTLPLNMMNLKEFSLSENVKTQSEPKFDEANALKERKINEKNADTPEKLAGLNGETIKIDFFSKNGKIGLDSNTSHIEPEMTNNKLSISTCDYTNSTRQEQKEIKPGEDMKVLYPHKDNTSLHVLNGTPNLGLLLEENNSEINTANAVNDSNKLGITENDLLRDPLKTEKNSALDLNNSDVNEKCDLINFGYYTNSSQQKQSDIKSKVLQPCNGYTNSYVLDESSNIDMKLQRKELLSLQSTELKDLQREDSLKIEENSALKIKYEKMNCTLLKPTDVQSENELLANQIKCISRDVEDRSLKKTSEENDFKVDTDSEKNLGSKDSQDSCEILNFECCSSKRNESANHVEEQDLNESVHIASGNANAKSLPNASVVEDVVNRIDLGFIYALGLNVP